MCPLPRIRVWSEESRRSLLPTETIYAQGNGYMSVKKMSWNWYPLFLFELAKNTHPTVAIKKKMYTRKCWQRKLGDHAGEAACCRCSLDINNRHYSLSEGFVASKDKRAVKRNSVDFQSCSGIDVDRVSKLLQVYLESAVVYLEGENNGLRTFVVRSFPPSISLVCFLFLFVLHTQQRGRLPACSPSHRSIVSWTFLFFFLLIS